MQIISHRGLWQTPDQRNTIQAFSRSLHLGFGLETDIRDMNGQLVISHDPPRDSVDTLDKLLNLYASNPEFSNLPLAINIKADGLAASIKESFDRLPNMNYFVFDMSVPDMRSYIKLGLPVYTRVSEVEAPIFYSESCGVWLDGFESEWFGEGKLDNLVSDKKPVCIVSPELHGRNYQELWGVLRRYRDNPFITLCTDFPEKARLFFFGL
jgi:hypothetical protein